MFFITKICCMSSVCFSEMERMRSRYMLAVFRAECVAMPKLVRLHPPPSQETTTNSKTNLHLLPVEISSLTLSHFPSSPHPIILGIETRVLCSTSPTKMLSSNWPDFIPTPGSKTFQKEFYEVGITKEGSSDIKGL